MKKIVLAASIAALTIGTGAYAKHHMEGDVTLSEAQAKSAEMFDKMDVNNDGMINAADRAARQAERFDRMDGNGDGVISRDEFDARHADRGKHGDGDRKGWRGDRGGGMKMMRMADADKDGSITRAEFDAGVTAMFRRADADNDGTVTAAERKAAHQAMRAQWRQKRAAD